MITCYKCKHLEVSFVYPFLIWLEGEAKAGVSMGWWLWPLTQVLSPRKKDAPQGDGEKMCLLDGKWNEIPFQISVSVCVLYGFWHSRNQLRLTQAKPFKMLWGTHRIHRRLKFRLWKQAEIKAAPESKTSGSSQAHSSHSRGPWQAYKWDPGPVLTTLSRSSLLQSFSRVWLFVILWTAPTPGVLLRLMSIESVMPSSHLILWCPLLLLPPIPPSIRVFSNESTLCMRWPKYWSLIFSISPSNEYSGLISFRIDWLDLLAVQGTLKSLLQHHSLKGSILWYSAFFIVQLSYPYMTMEKPQLWLDGPLWPTAPHFTPQGTFTHWWEALIQAPSLHHSPSKTCSQLPFGPGSVNTVAWFDLTAWGTEYPDNDPEKRIWDPGGQRWSQSNKSESSCLGLGKEDTIQWPNLSPVPPKASPRKRHHLGPWASSQDSQQKKKIRALWA